MVELAFELVGELLFDAGLHGAAPLLRSRVGRFATGGRYSQASSGSSR